MSHLKHVKVFCDQLEIGMFVSELDRSWDNTPFLLQGFEIQNDADILVIQSQCEYVFVDFYDQITYDKFRLKSTASSTIRKKLLKNLSKTVPFEKEILSAKKVHKQSSQVIKTILDSIILGQDFDIDTVKDAVRECVKSIVRNENAMLFLTMIKSKDDYTAEHCLNVGILSIAFARFLGYDNEKLEEIGLCGMLHDIGKIKVDHNILMKPAKLTPEEAEKMRQHARYGYEILLTKTVTPIAVDVAYSHHERLNGNGYPRGLKDFQISPITRLVAIVDTFDAITSARCYESARSIMDAYRVLMAGRNSHYDSEQVTKFIEWRGIYPPGSIVEMENGEVGIVTSMNPNFRLKPKVLLVLNEDKKERKPRLIDMSKLDLDPEAQTYRIIKAIPNRAFGIDLQDYLDKGLKLSQI